MAIKDFIWKPTNELRWYYYKKHLTQFDKQMINELQQKWVSETGKVEWREIPFVEESSAGNTTTESEALPIAGVGGRSEQLPYDYSRDIMNCPDCRLLPGICAIHDK